MTSNSPAVWIPLAVAIVTVIGSFVVGWLDRRGLRDPRIAESAANLGGAFGILVNELQEEVARLQKKLDAVSDLLKSEKLKRSDCEEERQQLLDQVDQMQQTVDELQSKLDQNAPKTEEKDEE